MALTFICWTWGYKYGAVDVVRLRNAIRKHTRLPHRFCVFVDRDRPDIPMDIERHQIVDLNLLDRSCFCRLRMFDPKWQAHHKLQRFVSLDLDLVITGEIDPLFAREESFVILQKVNKVNPNPFNASVMMLEAGHHSNVWSDFSIENAKRVPFHEFPDDQGWIWSKIPDAAGWNAGKESGIYGFQKPGWPDGFELPSDARIVAFIGKRKPQRYKDLKWIRQHWTALE